MASSRCGQDDFWSQIKNVSSLFGQNPGASTVLGTQSDVASHRHHATPVLGRSMQGTAHSKTLLGFGGGGGDVGSGSISMEVDGTDGADQGQDDPNQRLPAYTAGSVVDSEETQGGEGSRSPSPVIAMTMMRHYNPRPGTPPILPQSAPLRTPLLSQPITSIRQDAASSNSLAGSSPAPWTQTTGRANVQPQGANPLSFEIVNRLLSARVISKSYLTNSFSVAEMRSMHTAMWGNAPSSNTTKNGIISDLMRVCNATQPRSFVDALQRGAQGDGAAVARPAPTPAAPAAPPAAPPPVQASASNGSRESSGAVSMRRRVYVQSGRGWDDDRWRAHFLDLFRKDKVSTPLEVGAKRSRA